MNPRILYIYNPESRTDSQLCLDLERWLYSIYRQRFHTTQWHTILPGDDYDKERQRHFQEANLFFLLISVDFLSSDRCVEEANDALLQQPRGARIVPIILRPVADLSIFTLDKIQYLPRIGGPVTEWKDRDAAWLHIANEVKPLLHQFASADEDIARMRIQTAGATFENHTHVGPYRLDRIIGQGGFSRIYAATHERLGKRAAVKLLVGGGNPRARQIALVEAKAAIRVPHPSIVDIYEQDELADGTPFILMELLIGAPLTSGDSIPVANALRFLEQIASAIGLAHSRGVLHGDLKPYNMMVVRDSSGHERVKIFDFGIGRIVGEDSVWDTLNGIIGTLHYMAPELMDGHHGLTAECDVYTLGVTFYKLLTGHTPYLRECGRQLIEAMRTSDPPSIRTIEPSIPEEVATLVHRMLRRQPSDRPNMHEVLSNIKLLRKTIR